MFQLFILIAAAGLLASATPVRGRDNTQETPSTKLLIGGTGFVVTGIFNGAVTIDGGITSEDLSLKPTWIVPGKDGFIISDANSKNLISSKYDQASNNLTLSNKYSASVGVNHLTYNNNKTRLLGTTGEGIDVWDTSAADGSVKFIKSIPTNNNASYTTQVVADPSGGIFMVSDKNANSLIILSASDDNDIKVIGTIPIPEDCGPSRGAFYAMDGQYSTRYFALCQSTKEVLVLWLDLSAGEVKVMQRLQTSVSSKAEKRSVAELVLYTNDDNSADIYVSNSFVGSDTDTIAHFRLPAPGDDSTEPGDLTEITADRIVSSWGINPRGMSLQSEGKLLFVGNQQAGPAAVAVLRRDLKTGALGTKAEATLSFADFFGDAAGTGPSFVIPISS